MRFPFAEIGGFVFVVAVLHGLFGHIPDQLAMRRWMREQRGLPRYAEWEKAVGRILFWLLPFAVVALLVWKLPPTP